MLPRLPHCTDHLKSQFPEVYREFFASCQKAASASHSFLWMGEFAGFYGGLTLVQKLPLRSYVGFEITYDKTVSINRRYSAYEGSRQQFSIHTMDDRLANNLLSFLEPRLREDPHFSGLRVHFLAEVPFGHSLGSHGAIAAALSLLLQPSTALKKRFQLAGTILTHIQSGHSSGASAYAALAPGHGPIVYSHHDDKYFAQPIEDLAELTDHPIWPIDFGLIYSGTQVNTESVIVASDLTVSELEKSAAALNQLLHGSDLPSFRDTFINMLNMTTGQCITALVDLLRRGTAKDRLEHLFNTLNQYQNLLHNLDVNNTTTDLIYARMHAIASKQKNDVGSGAKISGMGKGGAMLFAVPYGAHRHDVETMIDSLREQTELDIWLDYASWTDGIGGEAGRVEQDLLAGQSSTFLRRDAMEVTVLRQGERVTQLVTAERLDLLAKECDILVDLTTGKLLIGGQALNSKELPSQKAAAGIIGQLIESPQFQVSNNKISDSYGQNRYDLHGKIILPLIKQVKRITKRDLQLKLHGDMYEDFTVSLDPSNVIIGVIIAKK